MNSRLTPGEWSEKRRDVSKITQLAKLEQESYETKVRCEPTW